MDTAKDISDKQSAWSKDNILLTGLFLLCIVLIYFSPVIVARIAFLIFALLAYRTKKDYFWIAFFFVLIDAPGRLFQGGLRTDLHRIPIYPIAGGISIIFQELFIWTYIIKVLEKRKKMVFIFKKEFSFLFVYILFVLLYSIPLGIDTDSIITSYRAVLQWAFVFILPSVLASEDDLIKFNRLIFPFVFIAFAVQLHTYITGQYLGSFLKGVQGVSESMLIVGKDSESAARVFSSMQILFYSFSQAMFYYFSKQPTFSKKYLSSIIIVSVLSIFLTATRGWIIGVSAIIFLTLFRFQAQGNARKMVGIAVAGVLIIMILIRVFPLINVQIRNTIARLDTLSALMSGDITANNTLQRIDKRGPRVMKAFKKSPIVGWGFSSTYFKYRDMHVAHHTMLLNVGIIGFIVFNFIFFKIVFKTYIASRNEGVRSKYGSALIIFCFVLLGSYVIHSSSSKFWAVDTSMSRCLFLSLIFASINVVVMQQRKGLD